MSAHMLGRGAHKSVTAKTGEIGGPDLNRRLQLSRLTSWTWLDDTSLAEPRG